MGLSDGVGGAGEQARRVINPHSEIPAYVQLAGVMRWRILVNECPVGAPLPGEQELADKYGVSRDTVRRACAMLRKYGMIETRRGLGHFVAFQPGLQTVTLTPGTTVTMRRPRYGDDTTALSPMGRAIFSPLIIVEEPGKPPAYYDAHRTTLHVQD